MTIIVRRPQVDIREQLNALRNPPGVFGEQLLRTNNAQEFYNIIGDPRNRIINGNMAINQRYLTNTLTAPGSGTYVTDRWHLDILNNDYNVQTKTDDPVPTEVMPIGQPGHQACIRITTATSRSPTSYHFFNHGIEGYNVADLRWGTSYASPVTVSFWVKSSLSGIFSLGITNAGNNYAYPTTFTINNPSVWEYKTIVIPGATGGTWNTTNGTGIRLKFNLNSGTSFDDTANYWTAADKATVANTVRIGSVSGAWLQLTGVQFEKGTVATPFEYRSFGQELLMCQRYYESTFAANITAPAKGATNTSLAAGGAPTTTMDWRATWTAGTIATSTQFKVPKAYAPTMTLWGTANDKIVFHDFGTKANIFPGLVFSSSTAAGFYSYNDATGLTNDSSWGIDVFNWSAQAEV